MIKLIIFNYLFIYFSRRKSCSLAHLRSPTASRCRPISHSNPSSLSRRCWRRWPHAHACTQNTHTRTHSNPSCTRLYTKHAHSHAFKPKQPLKEMYKKVGTHLMQTLIHKACTLARTRVYFYPRFFIFFKSLRRRWMLYTVAVVRNMHVDNYTELDWSALFFFLFPF